MTIDELVEFRKDIKKLSRKYRTIAEDVEIVKEPSKNANFFVVSQF
ncbi:MAG: hypothetical protein HN704_05190 [Bacteroidetes bacterium]|jgi:hypothetical protein|nr:hypothetical protein [Bacteroidota bacterium]MBT6685871.1 hypothetical protein [Bacteroidota bacterium]MBT7144065.1 hypothetical protein [Bacteroidota bacterium]MBT7490987.1 hypothetical protein [Bacteroidota bacterium]